MIDAPLYQLLRGVLTRDYGRLQQRLAALRRAPAAAAEASLRAAVLASCAERERRAALLPTPTFDEGLPVARRAEDIVALIRRHPVIVLAGETGSGKTTQLPKLCLAAGRGAAGVIGCTQPRRIAARAVARRVAEELNVPLGGVVGFQVRFSEQVGEHTAIKFMTDGILLAEIAQDRLLSRYDTLIIDEAHERSLNIDFLLGYVKGLLKRRRDLKVIVTSATIDTARFSKHFDQAPVIDVEGRSFAVEVRYRPPGFWTTAGTEIDRLLGGRGEGSLLKNNRSGRFSGREADARPEPPSALDAIVCAIDEITREDALGDVLVFLPGEREIHELHRALGKRRYRETEVLPLYARLSTRDQDRVFRPGPGRRIVLSTNVAETSLTVPRIRYVVDPGDARVKRYSPRQKLDRLHIEAISRASADQRKGRCGRVAAGVCYRLYAEPDYLSRPAYTDPEIRRAALAGVILRMLTLGLGQVEEFPFIDPPDARTIADGWQQLWELGAVDQERKLTARGRQMALFAIDVKLARMLIGAQQHDCLREMLAITAFLGIADPRERPADARAVADTAHAAFAHPQSEFLGIVALFDAYQAAHEEFTQSKLRDWCARHFLSFLRMREWRELHRQLLLQTEELGWSRNGAAVAARYDALHRAVLAGLPTQIGRKDDKQIYEGPRQRRFSLFPGSTLARQPPNWVLSAVLLDTQRVYALTNARIEPEWVIAEAAHLLARKHFDPHWSRAQGRVVGSEQISLFGVVLAPKRPVHYGGLYPAEAREIFVRQGLVTGEINTRSAFVARNLATLESAREEEAKARRGGLVADEDWQARWYLDRLPAQINSATGLDAWYRGLDTALRTALEWQLVDLLPGEGSELDRFPKYLRLGNAQLALHYRFEPGSESDGVTLDVPLHLLNALDEARLSWLVPGLVAEKATALIRDLPKALRRNFVPAPDFAQAFFEAHPQASADSLAGELARFLARTTGVALAAMHFAESGLEPHLRINLRLLDATGTRMLAQSRDLSELRARFGGDADHAFAARVIEGLPQSLLTTFPEHGVPLEVAGDAGLPAYPALAAEESGVRLKVFAELASAQAAHRAALCWLLRRALQDRCKQAARQLPVAAKTGLLYAAIESQERLRGDLVEAAVAALLEAEDLVAIRTPEAFAARLAALGPRVFAEAVSRLALADAIFVAFAELKPRLTPPLMGWGTANFDDLRGQLDALVYPGFLRVTPPSRLADYPRYLKGMRLRAERLVKDPQRDQARMLELREFIEALDANRDPDRAAWQSLRWALEELRVSMFAQELGTAEPVSAKRLRGLLAGVRGGAL